MFFPTNTRKAWVVIHRGHPSKVLQLKDIPMPTLVEGDILVKVHAAALNPTTYKLMFLMPSFLTRRPHVAEVDFSGTDANGSRFKAGDEVFGTVTGDPFPKTIEGALTTHLCVVANNCAIRPSTAPTGAAGFGAAALTALRGLLDMCDLQPGQTILINGGSSGVGAFAIQIAKWRGAKVVAVASGKNEALCRSLGADEFIDYTLRPLHETLIDLSPSPKYNYIYDAVGLVDPTLYTKSPSYLQPNGFYVSTGPFPTSAEWSQLALIPGMLLAILTPRIFGGTPRKWRLHTTQPSKERMLLLEKLVAEGNLKPVTDSMFTFEEAVEAYLHSMSGRARGKIVVKVNPDVE